jgi:peptidoglycan/xylan/chitin deacetylase (PgdA/CDA1 family)
MSVPKSMAFRFLARALPLVPGIGYRGSRRNLAIIVSHGVYDDAVPPRLKPPSSAISLTAFTSNVCALQKAFTFISMDEAASMLSGLSPWRDRCMALTFDDSLKCLAELVAPKLQSLGVPATFYLTTAAIETRQPYWWNRLDFAAACAKGGKISLTLPAGRPFMVDLLSPPSVTALKRALRTCTPAQCHQAADFIEACLGISLAQSLPDYPSADLMSWDDVGSLARMGMTIGSHTVNHANMAATPLEQMTLELEQSRQTLEARVPGACRHFCFPYGAHFDAACAAVAKTGYVSAVTTVSPGWNAAGADMFRLNRFQFSADAYKMPYVLSDFARKAERPLPAQCRPMVPAVSDP